MDVAELLDIYNKRAEKEAESDVDFSLHTPEPQIITRRSARIKGKLSTSRENIEMKSSQKNTSKKVRAV